LHKTRMEKHFWTANVQGSFIFLKGMYDEP
jgi:hypothetical protein